MSLYSRSVPLMEGFEDSGAKGEYNDTDSFKSKLSGLSFPDGSAVLSLICSYQSDYLVSVMPTKEACSYRRNVPKHQRQ